MREFRPFEETPTKTRPRSNSPQESPSPDFRKSHQTNQTHQTYGKKKSLTLKNLIFL